MGGANPTSPLIASSLVTRPRVWRSRPIGGWSWLGETHTHLIEDFQALRLDQAIAEALEAPVTRDPVSTRGSDGTASFGLSKREIEVLGLVTAGQTDQEIADALFIGRRTVTTHVQSILNKLGAENRVAAAALAVREGLA